MKTVQSFPASFAILGSAPLPRSAKSVGIPLPAKENAAFVKALNSALPFEMKAVITDAPLIIEP